jgi:multimeric flavodoxin WrbA
MDINILGICGSPVKEGNTEAFLKVALKAVEKVDGVRTGLFRLADRRISDCRHCNWCLVRQEAGKFCSIQDEMYELYPMLLESDAILLASPVYLGRLSGYMATASDRFRCLSHGRHYHTALKDKVGGALAVGWLRDGGAETTLISLFSALTCHGIITLTPPRFGGFYGAMGMASSEGAGKFDPKDKLGVLKDEYGMEAARSLARRVVEVAAQLKHGKQALDKRP